jgi:hypothetical protein
MTRLRHFAGLAAVAALLLALSAPAGAQTLGRLTGTVLDTSGGVLPGATVTLTNVQTNQSQTTVTNEIGAFLFTQLPAGTYKVAITLEGFKAADFTDVKVAVGQEYSLTAKLEIGAMSESVTVEAGSSLVATTSPEVTSTVVQKQVLEIPLANRDVTNLIKLQAGVAGISTRANTTVNGGRPTWTQVTLDGINIQDNFIRTNSLDFLPNRPTSDNVSEFSITTSVSGADSAGGATSVRMITPSGTNTFRGAIFETNRNAKFSANSFFNNASNVAKPALNRNQYGGRIGGPVMRDKLFFFFNYEGWRQKTQTARNLTIPANADFYSGQFRYVALDGTVQSVNVMQLSGLSVDPKLRTDVFSKVPASSNVNNYDVGNSSAGRLLNTAGYLFNQDDLNNRDSYTFRADYSLSQSHKLEGVFAYFKETDDRTDLDFVTLPRPLVYTNSDPKRFALAYRWIAGSNFQTELRGGGNLAPVQFVSDWDYAGAGGVLYSSALGIVNPIGGQNNNNAGGSGAFLSQGRYTNTYQLSSNSSMQRGTHDLQMGGSWQRFRVNPYNYAGQFPNVAFGFSSAAPSSVTMNNTQFPGGISAADLTNARAMAAYLAGVTSSVAQTYQVKDATSGYVPGIPADEKYTLDNIAAYLQDNWRWKPNFTVRAGIKWEYYSPLREDSNLGFLPVTGGRPISEVMLDPNAVVTFVNGDFYKKDLNNFGPTVGFAWDLTKDGKTAVRGGYSLSFVNEESVTVGRAAARGNAGLSSAVTLSSQYAVGVNNVPLPSAPAFLSERTLANQMALTSTAVLWGIDPNIQAPYVHQLSIGIQRELPWQTAVEARYVGTFGRDIWQGTDYNQIAWTSEFLADFNRARANGYAAQAAGLAYNPVYNPAVPGSQPLTVLNKYGTLISNATATSNLQTNQVGALADFFIGSAATAASARADFLQNPAIYSADAVGNAGFSDYNALQLELRRQFRNGFFGQVNYTFANTKTNSSGTAQNRFEAFMDRNRPELSTGRSNFHITHVINANAIYELPVGQGRHWMDRGGVLDAIFGGWQVSTIVAWQSGNPFTIYSGRGTYNRAGRSSCGDQVSCNTATSTLSADQIQKLIGVYKQPNGEIYWIDPKYLATTGRGVGADNATNTAGFDGQIFFNPGAGEVGNLPIMAFEGPAQYRIDGALSKRFRLVGRTSFELKAEAFNVLNHPTFGITGDRDINSTTFGRLTSVPGGVGSRVVQLSGRFEF